MKQWERLFDDRHGDGAYRRLATLLEQPCTTFAAIAEQFGVTRERVRQWHRELYPDGPSGHERKRRCLAQRSKRDLLRDPLFGSFYRHARVHFGPGQFALVPAREGFRRRVVRLDGHTIAIRRATLSAPDAHAPSYTLNGCVSPVDFIYYRLADQDFLFLPRTILPPAGATYRQTRSPRYDPFHNTFIAALAMGRTAAGREGLESLEGRESQGGLEGQGSPEGREGQELGRAG